MLTWLSQVGEASIDETSERFGLTPEGARGRAGTRRLLRPASLHAGPADGDRGHRLLGVGPPRRPADPAPPAQAAEGFTLAASARALLAVPGSDTDGVLRGPWRSSTGCSAARSLVVELDTPEMLGPVRSALAEGRQLDIGYYSASRDELTKRRIDPTRVFAHEGHWYVDAYCHEAGGDRRFRIDRIQQVEPGPPTEHRSAPADDPARLLPVVARRPHRPALAGPGRGVDRRHRRRGRGTRDRGGPDRGRRHRGG